MFILEQRYDADHDCNVYVMELRFEGFTLRQVFTKPEFRVDVDKLQPVEGGTKMQFEIKV